MRSVLPLLLAFSVLALLIGLVALVVKYSGPKKKEDYELPATPCPMCGKVTRIWHDLFADEPSHRRCDCVSVGGRWDKWEEHVKALTKILNHYDIK